MNIFVAGTLGRKTVMMGEVLNFYNKVTTSETLISDNRVRFQVHVKFNNGLLLVLNCLYYQVSLIK